MRDGRRNRRHLDPEQELWQAEEEKLTPGRGELYEMGESNIHILMKVESVWSLGCLQLGYGGAESSRI
jgi:hypothetical protein